MRRAPARFTIVPSAQRPTERPQLAAIIGQSNVAVAVDTYVVELPEDRAAHNSGILLRSDVREEVTDILEGDEPDVFDMGLDTDTGPVPVLNLDLTADDEVSGPHQRDELLQSAEFVADVDLETINDAVPVITVQAPASPTDAREMYQEIAPIPPAEAFGIQEHDLISMVPPAVPADALPPELLELTDEEAMLLQQAQALAHDMRSNPRQAFARVATEGAKVSRPQKRFFWDQLYYSRHPLKLTNNETRESIVARHTKTIETIAYQVVRHERATKCYYVVALEFGFQCLPAYADQRVKDALHRALRQKVEHLREVVIFIDPLKLTELTPDTVYMLTAEHKALAETVVETVKQGIKAKKTELQLLAEIAHIDPSRRDIVWHFYHLLKKPEVKVTTTGPQFDLAPVYRNRVASIADQLVAELNGSWRRMDEMMWLGFQMLPHNVDQPTTFRLRTALQKAVAARMKLAELTRQLPDMTPEATAILEKLANEIITKFSAEPFNLNKHVDAVWQEFHNGRAVPELTAVQKAALIQVLRPKVKTLRAEKKVQLSAQVQKAQQLIAATPAQKSLILQQVTQGMTPLDNILFHELMGEPLLNSAFGDHNRLNISITKPQSGAPLIAQKIDDESIAYYRKRVEAKVPKVAPPLPPIPEVVKPVPAAAEEVVVLDASVLEEEPTSLWQTVTRGVQRMKTWWGAVKTAVAEFSFWDFIKGNKKAIGATTVLAALSGATSYQAYNTYKALTPDPEIASASNSTVDAQWERPEAVRVQAAAYSQYMGRSEDGRPRTLNYRPVTVSGTDMFWHHHGLLAPGSLRLATATESRSMTPAGYEAVTTLHGEEQVQVFAPWQYTVHETGAMANIFNVLHGYMNSRTFKSVYPGYVPTPERRANESRPGDPEVRGDQSTVFEHLAAYHPRAHHILHRVRTGDQMTFGVNTAGEIVLVSWYNAEMINMLAGEPPITISLTSLAANMGEFSRSPSALARNARPQATPATTVAMLAPTNE